jgi:uncharacterized protein YndB with AHSA1/START domain
VTSTGEASGRSLASARSAGGTRDSVRWIRMERLLDASPARVHRAFSDPGALAEWFPVQVEGSLTPGTRSVLIWPDQRLWWDVLSSEPERLFRFRWPWAPDESIQTEVTIKLEPRGYGTRLSLTDGPFDVSRPGVLDAYAEALEGWGEALAHLRASVDFSVELRHRR